MLQLTTAALLIHGARRLDAFGRRLNDFLQRAYGIAFLHQRNLDAHLFLRQRALNKDGKAFVLADALTAAA